MPYDRRFNLLKFQIISGFYNTRRVRNPSGKFKQIENNVSFYNVYETVSVYTYELSETVLHVLRHFDRVFVIFSSCVWCDPRHQEKWKWQAKTDEQTLFLSPRSAATPFVQPISTKVLNLTHCLAHSDECNLLATHNDHYESLKIKSESTDSS